MGISLTENLPVQQKLLHTGTALLQGPIQKSIGKWEIRPPVES